MNQLSGKVALVTGAGSGIGRANSQVMAARGATLIVNDLHEASAEETVGLITAAGGRAIACAGDVSNAAAIAEAIGRARRQVGEIDILVNNAGVASGRMAFEDIDEATVDRMFDINVKGAMFCTRVVLGAMKERKAGKIINTSSIMGMAAQRRGSHYAAAKAALIGLTKAWAKEFADWNIQVNAVAPGRVLTPMVAYMTDNDAYREDLRRNVPAKRQAKPEEIGYLVAFLASSEADYLTGQVISPNGGEVI
ncbi:MAG: SDR family oxidoreductase [Burkholderiales bacterium]|nr:SDR family oxidoreductase [Burkholderiales bacterium]